jgi:hypothetical protein
MKHKRPSCVKHAIYNFGIILVCGVSILLAEPNDLPGNLEHEIKDLCRTVLSDPTTIIERKKLSELRKQHQQQRRRALDTLVRGLNSYINYQYKLAMQDLNKATKSQYVVELANSVLSTSLEGILDECKKQEKRARLCKSCFHTGTVACGECKGLGAGICVSCVAVSAVWNPSLRRWHIRPMSSKACQVCRGLGWFECKGCAGNGFVRCKKCGSTGGNERKAVEKMIIMATYLSDGGINFFTPDALDCSPRLGPEKSKDTLKEQKKTSSVK